MRWSLLLGALIPCIEGQNTAAPAGVVEIAVVNAWIIWIGLLPVVPQWTDLMGV